MNKKLKLQIETLNNKIEIQSASISELYVRNVDLISNLKTRDYLIRTNFLGTLKDDAVIYEFKQPYAVFIAERNKNCLYDVHTIKNEIIDYNFLNMALFMEHLKEYEDIQRTLDYYK